MMGELSALLAFALIVLTGQFSPGPDMLLLTRTALKEGSKAGLQMVCGIVTGLAFHAALAIAGVAVLMSQGGLMMTLMHGLAAGYLLWLAFGLIRSEPSGKDRIRSRHRPYVRGLLCNLFNPKVVVFFAGILTFFLTEDRPAWWPFALWCLIVGEGLVFWGLWVRLLQIPVIRQTYRGAAKIIDRVFAALLAGLAIALLCQL